MATSHDIGSIASGQISSFGNMQNYSRAITPFGVSMPASGMGQGQSFGPVNMASQAFAPMSMPFGAPGSFPGQDAQRAGMGMAGAAMQFGGALIPGKGTMGMAGYMMGGIPGMAFGLGAGVIGDTLTNSITMTVQNMNAVNNQMQSNRFMMGRGAGGLSGGGFTAGQIGQLAAGVQTAGMGDISTSVAEIRDITNQLANAGIFQTARDVPGILDKLKESLKAVRTIAVSAQTTFSEAAQIFGQVRQMGFTAPGAAAGMVQTMAAGQRAGVSMQEQMMVGQGAAQQAMSMGIAGAPAAFAAVQVTDDVARARQLGLISESDFMRMSRGTGQAGVASQAIQQANMRTAMGPAAIIAAGGRTMGAGLGAGGFGGGASFGSMINAAIPNLADPARMVEYMNNQDQVQGNLASNRYLAVEVAMSQAQHMSPSIPQDQAAMLILQRTKGMSSFDARMAVQQYNSRHQLAVAESMDKMLTAETDRQNAEYQNYTLTGISKRIGNAMYRVIGADMAEDTRAALGVGGNIMDWYRRKVTNPRSFAEGIGVERAMAEYISGTGKLPGSREAVTLGARGVLATDAAAFRTGHMGEYGFVEEESADSFIARIKEVKDQSGAIVGGTSTLKNAAAMRIVAQHAGQLNLRLNSNEGMKAAIESMDKLGLMNGITRSDITLGLVAYAQEKGIDTFTDSQETSYDLETLRKRAVAGMDAMVDAVSRGPFVKEMGRELTETIMKTGDLSTAMTQMAEAYGSGDTAAGDRALQVLSLKGQAQQLDKESLDRIDKTAAYFRKNPEEAKKFADGSALHEKSTGARIKLTAAVLLSDQIEQNAKQQTGPATSPLVALTMEFATALRAGDARGMRAAHQRLLANTALEVEAARGDPKAMEKIRASLGPELGSILDVIQEATPEERTTNLSGLLEKIGPKSFGKLQRQLESDERAGQKFAARGQGGDPYQASLTEYIGLNTRVLEALISGKGNVDATKRELRILGKKLLMGAE